MSHNVRRLDPIDIIQRRAIGQFKPRIGTAAFSTLLLKIVPESKELVNFVNYGVGDFLICCHDYDKKRSIQITLLGA